MGVSVNVGECLVKFLIFVIDKKLKCDIIGLCLSLIFYLINEMSVWRVIWGKEFVGIYRCGGFCFIFGCDVGFDGVFGLMVF